MEPKRVEAVRGGRGRGRPQRRGGRAEEYVFVIVGAEPLGGEPPSGELW